MTFPGQLAPYILPLPLSCSFPDEMGRILRLSPAQTVDLKSSFSTFLLLRLPHPYQTSDHTQ